MRKKLSEQAQGSILVVLAAIFWSTNAPFIKSLNLDAMLVAAMRALIAGIVLAPFIRPKKIKWGWPVFVTAILYILQCTTVVIAITRTSTPIAVGMQYTAPLWLFLFSRLKGEPFQRWRLVPLGVLTVGVVISMFSSAENVTMEGNLIALSSGLCFALLTYFMQKTGGGDPLGTVGFNNLFMAAVIIPLFCRGSLPQLLTLDVKQWIILGALGVFQIGLGYVFYNLALRKVSAARASMLSPLEMVLSPLWVAIFFHEYPDVIGMIGFSVIVAGVVIEVVCTQRIEAHAHRMAAQQAQHTA